MQIWRLNPIDVADPNWRASLYCGVLFIRAESEKAARAEARDAFAIGNDVPGLANPWSDQGGVRGLVEATIVHQTEYTTDGPTKIVGPAVVLSFNVPGP